MNKITFNNIRAQHSDDENDDQEESESENEEL